MSCQRELDELENFNKFRDFVGFYENLEQQLLSVKPDEAVIILGGGKTWLDNSIGLSIDNEEFGAEILFKQYLQLLMDIKNNLPVNPLGWVKLTIAHV